MTAYQTYYAPDNGAHNGSVKRRRAVLACTSCRRRKIRCDVGQPACGHCVKTGLECVYDSSKRRKTQQSFSDNEPNSNEARLEHRLERLESLLTTFMEKQGIDTRESSKGFSSENDSGTSSESELDDDDKVNVQDSNGTARINTKSDQDFKSDLFDIASRRGISHINTIKESDSEPWSVYSHGVTSAVMSPESMRWLCTHVGKPRLGRVVEQSLRWLWVRSERGYWDWCGKPNQTPKDLDAGMLRYVFGQFRLSESMPLKAVLSTEDVETAITQSGSDLDKNQIQMGSPYSLVFPALLMWFTRAVRTIPQLGPFSRAHAIEQSRLSFTHGIQILTKVFLVRPTTLLLRLVVVFIQMLSYRLLPSQQRSLVAVSLSMAMTLGLQREETFRNLDFESRKRKKLLWASAHNSDMTLSLYLFQQPLLTLSSPLVPSQREWEKCEAMWTVRQRTYINRLYMESYEKIFSVAARKTSTYRLLKYILKYDMKLTEWKRNLPADMRDPIEVADKLTKTQKSHSDEKGRVLEPYEVLDKANPLFFMTLNFVSYYHVLILLHSIPALTPSSLRAYRDKVGRVPERLERSLDIISDSARMILTILTHSPNAVTEPLTVYLASTGFSVLALKQLRTPRHTQNASDVLLLYRFIIAFKKIVMQPGFGLSEIMIERVFRSWLVITTVMSDLSRRFQPHVSDGLEAELQQCEEEARSGLNTSFLDEPAENEQQPNLGQDNYEKPTASEAPKDKQRSGTPQGTNFNTSSLRSPQSEMAVPPGRSDMGPQTQQVYMPMMGSTNWQTPLAQRHVPVPPPVMQNSPLHVQQPASLHRYAQPHLTPSYPNTAYVAPTPREALKTEIAGSGTSSPWSTASIPIQAETTYSSPLDESSLWEAFNGAAVAQDFARDQGMMQDFPDVFNESESTDDCTVQ